MGIGTFLKELWVFQMGSQDLDKLISLCDHTNLGLDSSPDGWEEVILIGGR